MTAYPKAIVSNEIVEDLRGAVIIGRNWAPHQDLDLAIRRIVDLAQRSLWSGINDPTTALSCIDPLGQAFGRLARRDIPSPMRLDHSGQWRGLSEIFDLEDVPYRAFAAIGRYGMIDADVVIWPAETLVTLEKPFPLGATVAVAKVCEQVVRESGRQTVHAYDRKILSDLLWASGKKP